MNNNNGFQKFDLGEYAAQVRKEVVEKENRYYLKKKVLAGTDMYNPDLGLYVFLYSDKASVACYWIDSVTAKQLAAEAAAGKEYWSGLLGPGGTIYDEPDEFFEAYGGKKGWISCDEFCSPVAAA